MVAKQFEIYWINLDRAQGAEIKKQRPCVVISPNELGFLKTRIIAPITSKGYDMPFRVSFTLMGKKALILCDQIRSISVERIVSEKIADLDEKSVVKLKKILAEMFA